MDQNLESAPKHLTDCQRHTILQLVDALYHKAAQHFSCHAEACAVSFKLRGRAAGQWRLRDGVESLHFNERLFCTDPTEHMPDTVAHEVAHSVVYRCHGRKGVRPHGREWREVMAYLGFQPRVTHASSAQTLVQALDHHLYRCACRSHALGPRQHRKVCNGQRDYRCRLCGHTLTPAQ
jgi:SprT protein